jgi:putative transposase
LIHDFIMAKRKIVHDYIIPDNIWMLIKSFLPLSKPKKKSGRPRKDDRLILSGVFYLLTGCQWKSLPRFYGAQAPSMIDIRSGKEQDSLRTCG